MHLIFKNKVWHTVKPMVLLSKYPWNERMNIPKGLRDLVLKKAWDTS